MRCRQDNLKAMVTGVFTLAETLADHIETVSQPIDLL